METILKTFFFKSMNNGFLYGPWIPVYGFGACLIIIIMRFIFNRIKVNRTTKIILLFLVSTIILTTLEFLGGHLIKLLTGKTFWNYSKLKYNIGPFISLEISLGRPFSMLPPPVITIPRSTISAASSGGVFSRTLWIASII